MGLKEKHTSAAYTLRRIYEKWLLDWEFQEKGHPQKTNDTTDNTDITLDSEYILSTKSWEEANL